MNLGILLDLYRNKGKTNTLDEDANNQEDDREPTKAEEIETNINTTLNVDTEESNIVIQAQTTKFPNIFGEMETTEKIPMNYVPTKSNIEKGNTKDNDKLIQIEENETSTHAEVDSRTIDNDKLTPDEDKEPTTPKRVDIYTLETKKNNKEISVTVESHSDTQEMTELTENISTNSLPDIPPKETVNTEDNDKYVPDEDMHTIQPTTAEVDKLETKTVTTVNDNSIDREAITHNPMNALPDIEQNKLSLDKDNIQPDETTTNRENVSARDMTESITVIYATEDIEENIAPPSGNFANVEEYAKMEHEIENNFEIETGDQSLFDSPHFYKAVTNEITFETATVYGNITDEENEYISILENSIKAFGSTSTFFQETETYENIYLDSIEQRESKNMNESSSEVKPTQGQITKAAIITGQMISNSSSTACAQANSGHAEILVFIPVVFIAWIVFIFLVVAFIMKVRKGNKKKFSTKKSANPNDSLLFIAEESNEALSRVMSKDYNQVC